MKSVRCLSLCFAVVLLAYFDISGVVLSAQSSQQRTFGVIKPSGMKHKDEIKSMISSNGLLMKYSESIILSEEQFDKLYFMHKEKPFYKDLKDTLVGKDIIVFILYGDNAVERYRNVIKDIRAKYALNKTENAVHGSDSVERAREEINIFFQCNKKTCKLRNTKKNNIK